MKYRYQSKRKTRYPRRSKKTGLPPGTLVHVGEQFTEKVTVSVMGYDESGCVEQEVTDLDDLTGFLGKYAVTWIDVAGLHDADLIAKVGERFHLHPLVMEDILNTTQRPKAEDLDEYLFVVFRSLGFEEEFGDIPTEQVSLVLGPNYVISFQERKNGLFDAIRARIKAGRGRIRKSGPDYLAYCLIDATVDNYFVVLEKLEEKIESLEEDLVTKPNPHTLNTIHNLKMNINGTRKGLWPLREVINRLLDCEPPLVQHSTLPYLRDVYDHTIHAIEIMEASRDIIADMLDIYLSSLSRRLNEIMKVLTVIGTIFMPLTFLTGWYGMNFKTMPELDWRYGYVMVICIAVSVVLTMAIFFKRKQWW